jgi:hypothetical protein
LLMMCVCAVGSPLGMSTSMNEKNLESGNGRQGNQPQPPYYLTELPQCKFYQQGISAENRVWFEILRNARGKYLVVIVVVLALCKVACEFLEKGSSNLSYKSIIGTLIVAGMVLLIGLILLRKNEDTNAGQEENREKIEQIESGTGGNGPGQDRRITERNRGTNPDGGSE